VFPCGWATFPLGLLPDCPLLKVIALPGGRLVHNHRDVKRPPTPQNPRWDFG
jgi:hypothetical protein